MKNKNVLNIGLMGFEFSSANKGCEALSYSFVEILIKLFPDKQYLFAFWRVAWRFSQQV